MTRSDQAELSIENRIRAVKLSIEKAAKESQISRGPLLDVRVNEDTHASFHLGLDLFGQDPSAVEEAVQEKLSEVESELKDVVHSLKQREGEQSGEHQTPEQLETEARQLQLKITFLRKCSKARALLDESINFCTPALAPNGEADLPTSARKFVEAHENLKEAQQVVDQSETVESADSSMTTELRKMLESLRTSLRRQKLDIIAQAITGWQNAVELGSNSLSVRGTAEDLGAIYEALEIMSTGGSLDLDDLMRKFIRKVHNTAFAPALEPFTAGKGVSPWNVNESEQKGSGTALTGTVLASNRKGGRVRVLEWSIDQSRPQFTGLDAWKATLRFFEKVLSFLVERVLLNRESLCSLIGLRLFGKPTSTPVALNLDLLGLESRRLGDDHGLLMDPLIDSLRTSTIPEALAAEKLADLKVSGAELEAVITPFGRVLKSLGLLPNGTDPRLMQFAETIEKQYVDSRRFTILNEALRLLNETDYHNTVEVGVAITKPKADEPRTVEDGLSVFKLEKCAVSSTAKFVLELCRKAMDEAVAQQGAPQDSALHAIPAVLYRTAREVLDMFRAIIPVKHCDEIKNLPRTAAVLHNDCIFLGRNCMTLGLEYRAKFTDSVPLEGNSNALHQTFMFVDMVPLYRDLADRSLVDMLDFQARQLVDMVGPQIHLLGDALRSDEVLVEWSNAETGLDGGLYHLRHLFQTWKPVLSRDILTRSMWFLADVILELLIEQIVKARDISTSACQFVSALFQKATGSMMEMVEKDTEHSRVLDKFNAIGRFMDMSLGDVELALSDGVFCSMTGSELTKLIMATFDDTPKRRNVLRLIAGSPH